MRIGFVTSVVSKRLGGIQNTSYYFSKYFSEKQDFEVFCSNESETEDLKCKIFKTNCKSVETIQFHFQLLKKLFKANSNNQYDFTFAALYPCAFECFLLKKIKKVPYGVMMHGNELLDGVPRGAKQKILMSFRHKVRSKILNNADILFANSEYTKTLCMNKFENKNIVVIHPPIKFIDKNSFKTDKEKIIVSLGRLEKRKGFQYVIQAMEKLSKDIPDLKYLIAGGGPYEKELSKLIREKGLDSCVKLLGRVSEEEKDSLYRKCDYFIMPSYIVEEESSVEGFGIVFIEANMYGKYVIATRSGGIPDAIQEHVTGEFVETENADSIVETIRHLYLNDFMYDPDKCIEWAKNMDIEKIVDEYIFNISDYLGK